VQEKELREDMVVQLERRAHPLARGFRELREEPGPVGKVPTLELARDRVDDLLFALGLQIVERVHLVLAYDAGHLGLRRHLLGREHE